MVTVSFLSHSNIGSKVSSIDETAYIKFFLHGETASIVGLCIPNKLATLQCRFFVAVAVNAIMLTPSDNILRISPIRKSTPRNVSPLLERERERERERLYV